MKPIDKMNKAELVSLATESGLEVESSDTVKSLKIKLRENGVVSDKAVNQVEEEVRAEKVGKQKAETDDKVVVKITKDVTMYKFGKYRFSKANPYVLMDKVDAEILLGSNPNLFVKPTVDEVKRAFE